ncbi:MAG: hypothetical protein Q8O31_07170 [Rhodocyclaceae bacterium]|nr:hypothetical protein [Rhodocyclaceae bacterium]
MKHAPLTPIPSPTLPLKGRERCSSPFKGEAGRGGRDAPPPSRGRLGGGWGMCFTLIGRRF